MKMRSWRMVTVNEWRQEWQRLRFHDHLAWTGYRPNQAATGACLMSFFTYRLNGNASPFSNIPYGTIVGFQKKGRTGSQLQECRAPLTNFFVRSWGWSWTSTRLSAWPYTTRISRTTGASAIWANLLRGSRLCDRCNVCFINEFILTFIILIRRRQRLICYVTVTGSLLDTENYPVSLVKYIGFSS